MNKARIKTSAKITISPEYFNAERVSVFGHFHHSIRLPYIIYGSKISVLIEIIKLCIRPFQWSSTPLFFLKQIALVP